MFPGKRRRCLQRHLAVDRAIPSEFVAHCSSTSRPNPWVVREPVGAMRGQAGRAAGPSMLATVVLVQAVVFRPVMASPPGVDTVLPRSATGRHREAPPAAPIADRRDPPRQRRSRPSPSATAWAAAMAAIAEGSTDSFHAAVYVSFPPAWVTRAAAAHKKGAAPRCRAFHHHHRPHPSNPSDAGVGCGTILLHSRASSFCPLHMTAGPCRDLAWRWDSGLRCVTVGRAHRHRPQHRCETPLRTARENGLGQT